MSATPSTAAAPTRRDRSHYLYLAVIVAVLLGIAVGFIAPEFATSLKPIGEAFVAHGTVNHSANEYARAECFHTNNAENYF